MILPEDTLVNGGASVCLSIYYFLSTGLGSFSHFLYAKKALRVSRGIALLFHDLGTRRGREGQPHDPGASTPWKDPVPIVQEAGEAPRSVWTGGKFRPHRDSIPDRPARSQSRYRLSYRAHLVLA